MSERLSDAEHDALLEEVRGLKGVRHAILDAQAAELWVEGDVAHEQGPIAIAVKNAIASLGHDPDGLDVRITAAPAEGPRRRVRFVDVHRDEEHGSVRITVDLEWGEAVHTGSANGAKGSAIELKTTAHAALDALERLTDQALGLRVIGVKSVHAFDSHLMVASLLQQAGRHQRLVGAVVVTDGPLHAAALAVLTALNRTLGNFLQTTD